MEKPEFGGQCAFAVSVGKKSEGKEKHKIVKNGKTYYFSNPIAKLLWKILPNSQRKAELNWKLKV